MVVTLPVNAENHRQTSGEHAARAILARTLAGEGVVEDAEVH